MLKIVSRNFPKCTDIGYINLLLPHLQFLTVQKLELFPTYNPSPFT